MAPLNGLKTYIGIIIAVAPTLASLFGFNLSPTFGDQFTAAATDIITLLGAGLAIYGRLKAEVPGWWVRK